jgi:hypothetical protein
MAAVVDAVNDVPSVARTVVSVKRTGRIAHSLPENTPCDRLAASVIASRPSATPVPNRSQRIPRRARGSCYVDHLQFDLEILADIETQHERSGFDAVLFLKGTTVHKCCRPLLSNKTLRRRRETGRPSVV